MSLGKPALASWPLEDDKSADNAEKEVEQGKERKQKGEKKEETPTNEEKNEETAKQTKNRGNKKRESRKEAAEWEIKRQKEDGLPWWSSG